jgi:hypothetical protein
MAIRQIGGQPVYVVEVDVPKVTDARGKSYGTLVSDLRWKLWEEVQNSQLQQMKYEQMSKQAQLDVLEQKQRDISRSIRDARELQSKIKSGAVSAGEASRLELQRARAEQGKTVVKTEPARDPFTGELIPGEFIETVTVTTPNRLSVRQTPPPRAEDVTAFNEIQKQTFGTQMSKLDEYIAGLEAQQKEAEAEFAGAVGRIGTSDILSRTRGAFQTQIGEGGFGISRRPLRELPRFDERAAMGVIGEASKREESALLDEALRRKSQNAMNRIAEIQAMGQEDEMTGALLQDLNKQALNPQISLDEERKIRELARKRLAEGMTAAGAQPTGRAGFLMRELPQPSALLPREETRFPTGRMRDDFAVESEGGELDRETVVRGELDRVGLGSPEAEGLLMELEDIRRTKRAPINAPSSLPEAQRRAIELDALGVTAEEAQTRGATPTERGFTLPVERMGEGFGQTTTFGAPGGVLDRTNVATRRLPEALSPSKEREEMESIQFGGGVIPGPATIPGMEDAATDEVEEVEDTVTVPRRGELPQGSELPQAKKTIPQRRELYSMKIVKEGAKLAEKPKQFARVAKTANPSTAPDYVKLVNQIYELNSNRPDRFKLTFDEIARVYKDDPKTREKAHAFLVAADMLQEGVTRPQA